MQLEAELEGKKVLASKVQAGEGLDAVQALSQRVRMYEHGVRCRTDRAARGQIGVERIE
jgi:hypothetical protein